MQVNRRQLLKICSSGMAGTSLAALGFTPSVALANARQYKLLRAREVRGTCPYCAVGCGLLMYSRSDGSMNAKETIFHVEGDPDNPVSRGALCPKGAGLLDFVHSKDRLTYPEYRAPGSNEWKRISWDDAISRIARLIKDDRDANFVKTNAKGDPVNRLLTTGMLVNSNCTNEIGYLTHKFVRALGLLCVDQVARVCHGPSVAGLAPSFGRGAMTNHWVDIKNANLVLIMGGNPAEAHPVGFRWVIEAKIHNNAKVVVVDPRFNRSAAVADHYVPLRPGTDIAFLNGVLRYLIENGKFNQEYVRSYTNASFLVRDDFDFHEGLFTGYDEAKHSYDKTTWDYQYDEKGYAKRDPTLAHPRSVWSLMKKHVDRYTPETVANICGTPKESFLKVCELLAETSAPDKTATILYALGWTEHTIGSQNIRTAAMAQLLLGNMGMAGGGINALRGQGNIQGTTDVGPMATYLPGYVGLPSEKYPTLQSYITARTPKAMVPGQVNYWSNFSKFFVSLLKAFYGSNATPENDFGYAYLPKWDTYYDTMHVIDRMYDGKVNGYICQGYNPLATMPNSNKVSKALAKLKFLVVIDPFATETSCFWENHGEINNVDPAAIQTEVFRLPASCFAEDAGATTNAGRVLQWHWKGAEPPGEAKTDREIVAALFLKIRELYEKEGGTAAEPLLAMAWDYSQPLNPSPEDIAREMNGKALADLKDADGNIVLRRGQQISGFGQLRDDGSTAAGCWVYAGSWTEAGNQMARRDNSDPSGLGSTLNWAWAWPANRRVLYNRASLDPQGNPWDAKRALIRWDGAKWSGFDIPDFPAIPPGSGAGPFIMQADGVGHLFALNGMNEGPFPEHYEPVETPLGTNPLHPKVVHNPAARILANDAKQMGHHKDFPYVCTTYRLTEHYHTQTKHSKLNAITQPEAFAEISETLANKIGVRQGDDIKVSSLRGFVRVKAVVTKRIKTLQVNGQSIETVGLPFHWAFKGETQKGFMANTLPPAVGDANTQTPEYKAFLVNVERA